MFLSFSLFLFICPLNPEAPVAVCPGKVLPRVTSCLWPPWARLPCQPCAGGTARRPTSLQIPSQPRG